ncbi:MAG: S9 family peptidase [Fidelibacterota bacterium]|nr:MAG: S9 family peptidase [Candidatus Neomarinimicrobiota bacterium]
MKKSAWILLWLLLHLTVVLAQGKRPMTLVDILEVPELRDPLLSPDGRQLVYVLAEADWEANKRISHIWIINTDGANVRQLTNGDKGERSPCWTPDGEQIAFLATRGDAEEAQIFLIRTDGGEARQLTRHETSISSISWSPDGAWIYFLASNPKTDEEKEREESKDDVFAYEEDYQQRHLWKVSVSDQTEERITEGDYSILSYRVSRDGKKIVFHQARSPVREDTDRSEVWVMDAKGKKRVQLTRNSITERGAELSPDNSRVLFISWCNQEFEPYYNNNLFVIPVRGGEARLLLPDMPHEVRQASWSADGGSIYFTANTGVRAELFQVELAGERLQQLTTGDHTIRSWSYEPGLDQHVFAINEPTNAGDVWMLASKQRTKPVRITHVYDYLARDFKLPRQEAIRWMGADGVEVEGLLHYPLGYKQGRAYPLVVQTHGGPRSSDKFGFSSYRVYIPVLTARGYAVLAPNYRGSTGYGDEFLRDMVGSYFNQSHLDVMTGVDHLIDRGIVDGDRLIKMGWSAGGHMTNKIITHTGRFKAASSGAGAVNWISMYGQSDTRNQRTSWFGGTPWQPDAPIDVYWEHSPLREIWKVTTPTIILVGENDPRVPLPQSMELYRAIKANGVPTHLYIAPREPHGWRELRHQLFKMNVEIDWFEQHAMGREYVWEKAPEEKSGN